MMRRTLCRLGVIAFVASGLCSLDDLSWNRARSEETVASTEVWYVPLEADFRDEYERDVANQAKQSWNDYWGWVVAFYKGNVLATGWDERARTTLTCVDSEERRKVVRVKLNAIGREMCREWAKDGGVRKLNSSDLVRWGKQLDKAREKDRGQGEELEKELVRISGEVKRKVGS